MTTTETRYAWLHNQCNRLMYGYCMTAACLHDARQARIPGQPLDMTLAHCIPYDLAQELGYVAEMRKGDNTSCML